MSGFDVSIRLNLRPETAGPVIDALGPVLRECGLSFRNGAPGLITGSGIAPADLGLLLDRVAAMTAASEEGLAAVQAGVIDDLWVHVSRARP